MREIENERRKDENYSFENFIKKLNSLLDNTYIQRGDIKRGEIQFKIFKKGTKNQIGAEFISSGESELISLGIECLIYSKEIDAGKENILFLDEPDVHLHPDLQYRLMLFLKELTAENNFRVLIATHSTAILGALNTHDNTHIAFMGFEQKNLDFKPVTDIHRKILPVFGAHPLSNVFNEAPVMLVEGEDDERVWQQAVRTSNGKIKIYPCACDGITEIHGFEEEVGQIITSIYNDAKGYSLRDGDDKVGDAIADVLPVVKFRLDCYSAENILLSNEVLLSLSVKWDDLKKKMDEWLAASDSHVHYEAMKGFKESSYDRKNFKLKDIRNDLMGIIGNSKPWEVAVGQVIGNLVWDELTDFSTEGSIFNFLGEKLVKQIIPKNQ